MPWKEFYVSKRTGTYSDVLTTYGLAALVEHIFRQACGPHATWKIDLEDSGNMYILRLSEPLEERWLDNLGYFEPPVFYIARNDQEEQAASQGVQVRNVNREWETVRLYAQQRQVLRDQKVRGSDLEQQLRDLEPSPDWTLVAFVGDGRMQAMGIYNRLVEGWTKMRDSLAETLRTILDYFSAPDLDTEDVLRKWADTARQANLKVKDTASQLLNPHQGKGLNEPKANALRMDNIRDRPWPEEFLKAVGLWQCMAPVQVGKEKDWKVYVLAPLRFSLGAHREAFRRFRRYLWREGETTSLKADIIGLLLFLRAWLDYVETEAEGSLRGLLGESAPERVVAGFHVAQFKQLSRQAYTMVNLSFLRLPAWSGDLRTQDDAGALKEVIDEHLEVIRSLDETRSDGFDLLRRYREFVAGNNWDAFFDFLAGHSHDVLRRLSERARWVPTFTTENLRRLLMNSRKDLLPILQNQGFQNLAYAIRHSTIIPQSRKAQGLDTLYEVRYGLGAELKRKAAVRDEFIVALMNFVHQYDQENVQKLETQHQQMRRDVRTSDVDEVIRLVDEYGSELVASLLVAYGYAREPREESGEEKTE